MKLSEKIYACRKRAGMSQVDLADALGVSRQAVSKWETGEANPDVTKIPQLSALFGVTADWLLSEDPIPEASAPEVQTEPEPQEKPYPDWVENLPRHMMSMVKRFGWLYGVRMAVSGGLFAAVGLLGRFLFRTMIFSGSSLGGFSGGYSGWAVSGDLDPSILNQISGQLGDVGMNPGFSGIDSTAWSVASAFTGFIIALGVLILIAGVVLAIALKKWGDKENLKN